MTRRLAPDTQHSLEVRVRACDIDTDLEANGYALGFEDCRALHGSSVPKITDVVAESAYSHNGLLNEVLLRLPELNRPRARLLLAFVYHAIHCGNHSALSMAKNASRKVFSDDDLLRLLCGDSALKDRTQRIEEARHARQAESQG